MTKAETIRAELERQGEGALYVVNVEELAAALDARGPTDEEIVAGLLARASAMRKKIEALELEEQHATTFNRERVQLVHALTYRARRLEDLAHMLEKFGDELVSKKTAATRKKAKA